MFNSKPGPGTAAALLYVTVLLADCPPALAAPATTLPASGASTNTSTDTAHPIDFTRARQFWSFSPIHDPPPPTVHNQRWAQTSIDPFILAQLERNGLTPNPRAEKRILLRRVTFDLTGLPPTLAEIEDFLRDTSPVSFEKVVDRLLASPAYGERWGRHWLDLARYADTAGESADYPIPQAGLYRDYVIAAFNQDKPYDQFLREQIAGDLLPARTDAEKQERIIATGYLALARRFSVEPDHAMHLTIEDALDTLGRSVLGLSLSCARCHDHKYDPISTADYYALYGILQSTRFPYPGSEEKKRPRDLIPLMAQAEIDALLKPYQEKLHSLRAEVRRLEREKNSLTKILERASETGDGKLPEAERARFKEINRALAQAKAKADEAAAHPPPIKTAYAVAEGRPGPARIQRRGEPTNAGDEVPRRFLQILGGQPLPADCQGSGRLELAGWLTDRRNPLTPRVLVNRIWQHHFGKGLVETPSDFGTRGRPSTHPEFLDFLASRFIDSGWSIKAMHRLILLSQTYQQSSRDHREGLRQDPNNSLLWKFSRLRLEAEPIRDAMLALSGDLDTTPPRPHPFPAPETWSFTQHTPFNALYETRQRSVYLMQQRIKRHPFLALFDGADPNSSTAERSTTLTPLQALFMINDPFVHEQSRKLTERLLRAGPRDEERIELVYQLLFGRMARPSEVRQGQLYLHEFQARLRTLGVPTEQHPALAWASFTRGLLASNEFIYID